MYNETKRTILQVIESTIYMVICFGSLFFENGFMILESIIFFGLIICGIWDKLDYYKRRKTGFTGGK